MPGYSLLENRLALELQLFQQRHQALVAKISTEYYLLDLRCQFEHFSVKLCLRGRMGATCLDKYSVNIAYYLGTYLLLILLEDVPRSLSLEQ